jgi:hypothetical protein
MRETVIQGNQTFIFVTAHGTNGKMRVQICRIKGRFLVRTRSLCHPRKFCRIDVFNRIFVQN